MSSLLTKGFQKLVLLHSKMGSAETTSTFQKTGKITPDEFLAAGDFLVENFPSWHWEGGDADKQRDFLPADKQFLRTRDVPCLPHPHTREDAKALEREVETDDADGGWLETGVTDEDDAVAELGGGAPAAAEATADDSEGQGDDSDSDVPDLDDVDYDEKLVADDDPASLTVAPESATEESVMQTRTYDISVTYDVHYSTPRVWLFGYDSNKNPLKADEWQSDFSPEHLHKTVTHEQHPHLSYSSPSIHPCKHAQAMLKMISLYVGDKQCSLDVKLYLLIFLKFIQAIIPNIEYDYTQGFEIGSSDSS